MRYTRVLCAWLVLIGGGVAATTAVVGAQAPATLAGPEAVTRVLDQYCVTCHNARLKTADLVLDGLDPSDVALNTETWEQVVRKLRQRAMPPAGRPRPEDATSDALATWLETSLDSAAAAAPDPGRRPALHRLSRTEYRNAVRDLLALDDLPKELDVEVMLPADNATSGFDNLADLLFVSPTLMERYLGPLARSVGWPSATPRCCRSSTPTGSTATSCRTNTSKGYRSVPGGAPACGATCRSMGST